MAELTVYRLTFRSGFHIGVRGVNLEESGIYIPSTTLFAAMFDASLRAGGDPERLAKPFVEGDPPFLLTSAFPYAGEVYFFPMPVPLDRWFTSGVLQGRTKELKRIKFLSENLFRLMLEGKRMDEWLFPEKEETEPTNGLALQGGTFWLTVGEAQKLPPPMRSVSWKALRHHIVFATTRAPRVTLDRISSTSNIFYAGKIHFSSECGLWFGVQWRSPNSLFKETFRKALAILAHDGLGGDRTIGYGGFEWEETTVNLSLPEPENGGLMWLLSRYHPRDSEFPGALAGSPGYVLTPLAGWLRTWQSASRRRKRLWLISEGSLVQATGSGPWGNLIDVRPDDDFPHPVWCYGFAIGAGVKEVFNA